MFALLSDPKKFSLEEVECAKIHDILVDRQSKINNSKQSTTKNSEINIIIGKHRA